MAQPVWNTPAGSLGSYPSLLPLIINLSASAVLPASTIVYTLLSGTLPDGLSIDEDGIISGTPDLVTTDNVYTFAVRATDNLQNIRDRTFSIEISGTAAPSFNIEPGSLLNTNDSTWVELPITYNNPLEDNPVVMEVIQGALPPGLEINEAGIIRGYADPPIVNVTLPSVVTAATVTSTSNEITCLSTSGFSIGRPVVFSGTVFGDIEADITYYIKSVINSTSFTITETQDGPTFDLTDGTGSMTVTLPTISVGQPTIRTFSFTLKLDSPLGSDIASYSITVTNQNTPVGQGGPGFPANTRIPTIFNTRPATFYINDSQPYYGYYIVPNPLSDELTIPPSEFAFIGTIQSDNYFAFKIIGYDFDGNELEYSFSGLPFWLTGDTSTGWITGTLSLATEGINQFSFSVAVQKILNPAIQSPYINFSFNLAKEINGDITWLTPQSLGTIFNGTVSTKNVLATSDVELEYRLVGGSLPPNLSLLSNGEITGYVANQPTETFLSQNTTTDFSFTIQAYSPTYPIIQSNRTFSLTVLQKYAQPTDVLYIKATPSLEDRAIISDILTDDALIPESMLYRPSDVYFGKSTSVIYEHAYGIYASNLNEYLAAVTRNHYWRNIILGELETAVAKNSDGEVIYEVVYSKVIDNLINPQGQSVSSILYWPRPIDLNLGPWYTSVTNIYTSYAFNELAGNYVITESGLVLETEGEELLTTQEGQPTFYTSLTPGYATTLYPNSLFNMRNRVGDVLGQEFDSTLLPLWMTSQQANGSTLGYTQAWVICYTKPGFSTTIKNNLENKFLEWGYGLNKINFRIDRFSVDKSITYNYDKNTSPPTWTGLPSATPVPDPLDSKDFYVLFPRKTILPDDA